MHRLVNRRLHFLLGIGALTLAVAIGLQWHRRLELRQHVFRIGFEDSAVSQVVDGNGKPGGPAIEIVTEAARRAHIQLRWVYAPAGPDRALTDGQVELWPLLGRLPDRVGRLFVSLPWRTQQFWLLNRVSRAQPGETVAVLRGNGRRMANLYLPGRRIIEHKKFADAIAAICRGEAQSGLLPEGPTLPSFNARPPACAGVKLVAEEMPDARLSFGTGAAINSALARKAAEAIRAQMPGLVMDGTVARIDRHWSVVSANELVIIQDFEASRRKNSC